MDDFSAAMAERDQVRAMLKDDAALFAEFYAHLIRERVPKDAAAHITAVYMQTQLMRIAASEQGG